MTVPLADEAGILLEFIYTRLRGNSSGWDVVPMPVAPDATFPCYGFNITHYPSVHAQGGDVNFTPFLVNVWAIGEEGVDDLEPLRAPAREAAQAIQVTEIQPGLDFGSGRILSSTQNMPVSDFDRTNKGRGRWVLGAQWLIHVQPDRL